VSPTTSPSDSPTKSPSDSPSQNPTESPTVRICDGNNESKFVITIVASGNENISIAADTAVTGYTLKKETNTGANDNNDEDVLLSVAPDSGDTSVCLEPGTKYVLTTN